MSTTENRRLDYDFTPDEFVDEPQFDEIDDTDVIKKLILHHPELETQLANPDNFFENDDGQRLIKMSIVASYLDIDIDDNDIDGAFLSIEDLALLYATQDNESDEDETYTETQPEDPTGIYLKEAGRVPLLTAEAEIELAKRMELAQMAKEKLTLDEIEKRLSRANIREYQKIVEDGELAKEHLVKANMRLVISVAKKHVGQGVPFLDLIQEGNIGLMRATDKFDYKRGNKFSTYATWWIRQGISRAVAEQGRTIRVPVHQGDRIRRMNRITLALKQELGRDPDNEELAVAMETTPVKIDDLKRIASRPMSLETPIGDEEESEFGDFIKDETSPDPESEAVNSSLKEQIIETLGHLPLREAKILRLRYGLEDGRIYTLEEVGNTIGVTRKRVRQLEAHALGRIRQSSTFLKLKDHYFED